jgi:hypothetical protein
MSQLYFKQLSSEQLKRRCVICNKVLKRRKRPSLQREAPSIFIQRKTCSRRCAWVLIKRERDGRKPAPLCAFCEQQMPIRNRRGEIRTERFCSCQCAGLFARLEGLDRFPEKKCECCRKELVVRPRETPKMFKVRRFCDYKCRGAWLGDQKQYVVGKFKRRSCLVCGRVYRVMRKCSWRMAGFCSRKCKRSSKSEFVHFKHRGN